MTAEHRRLPCASLTVLDVLERLCGIRQVTYGGASLFHDEFGHIVSPILLTQWPQEPRLRAPVVFSTDCIVPEQIAELCQRMMLRASPRSVSDGIINNPIHVAGTLDELMMRRVEAAVFGKLPHPPTINWPDERGHKLSKTEALAWTYLFAVEDIHIFAERYSTARLDPERLAEYRELVAELMYDYALRPEICGAPESRHARHDIIRDCFDALDVERNWDTEFIYGHHLSDTFLGRFYDTFLPYFDALDAAGAQLTGSDFSRLSIEELHTLDVSVFLPERRPPFDWIFEGAPTAPRDDARWLGVLRYDATRELWLIVDVVPPETELRVRPEHGRGRGRGQRQQAYIPHVNE